MARKRIRLQDDSSIKELENKITESISSNTSLNSLADLTSLAASLDEPHTVLKAIYACYRVFVLLISKGWLANPADERTNVVRTWIFERLDEYVRLLCGLLQDEESLLRVCHLDSSLLVILTFSPDISARYPHVALETPFYFAE
jgi:U3 small nucleolar RNA-associated protein 19